MGGQAGTLVGLLSWIGSHGWLVDIMATCKRLREDTESYGRTTGCSVGALIILGLRIVDVSMGTVRMILGVRGYRGQAAAIGFFEVLIWLIAVGVALRHLTPILHIVGYAGGGQQATMPESGWRAGSRSARAWSERRSERTAKERSHGRIKPLRHSAQRALPAPR